MGKQGRRLTKGQGMQRAKKREIAPSRSDGLELCLDCWKAWMHGDSDRDLRAKTMGGLIGNSDGYGKDSDEQQQAADNRIAAATDAMIDSLKRIHIWAIYRSCSIATPCNYPNAQLLIVGPEAMEELKIRLKKNVCTAVLF